MALIEALAGRIPGLVEAPVEPVPLRRAPFNEIADLLADDLITDVLINGPGEVWVERSGVLTRVEHSFADAGAVVASVERTIAPLGLRLDLASPFVSARLADGSRLHAVIPPIAVDRPVVAIRRFMSTVLTLDDFVSSRSCTAAQADLLRRAVADRRNIVVSGGTGAGKTTLLNALSAEIGAGERVVSIEDAAELQIAGHVVSLESRAPNSEGAGGVDLTDLVRTALRLRPDRIVVGEVRGPEALDMIAAMNTGHDGSMSTVHANGPEDALWRLETLALVADGPGEAAVRRQLWSAVDLVVHIERRAGQRAIAQVAEVDLTGCEVVA